MQPGGTNRQNRCRLAIPENQDSVMIATSGCLSVFIGPVVGGRGPRVSTVDMPRGPGWQPSQAFVRGHGRNPRRWRELANTPDR
jgi:hypothetical protein